MTVARRAGLENAQQLLGLPKDHALRKEISRSSWDAAVRGAGDPLRIEAGTESLAGLVARVPGYEGTDAIPRHALFRYATDRDPQAASFNRLMLESPIIEITEEDWLHREWMGLVSDADDGQAPRLIVDWQEFRSLDRLFVLARALESAHRAGERDQAFHLEQAWRAAAGAFGASVGLRKHTSDYWQWFIDHVMSGPWWPTQPSEHELEVASKTLVQERGNAWLRPHGRERIRRRDNDIVQRAMALRTRRRPLFMFIPTEPRWRWLVTNRDLVSHHVSIATRQALDYEVTSDMSRPMSMPATLYCQRVPPPIADTTYFLGPTPYDLLPVEVIAD